MFNTCVPFVAFGMYCYSWITSWDYYYQWHPLAMIWSTIILWSIQFMGKDSLKCWPIVENVTSLFNLSWWIDDELCFFCDLSWLLSCGLLEWTGITCHLLIIYNIIPVWWQVLSLISGDGLSRACITVLDIRTLAPAWVGHIALELHVLINVICAFVMFQPRYLCRVSVSMAACCTSFSKSFIQF